jgi:ClpP class serine protease
MGASDLFWMFFILTALQPMIRQKLLEAARQRLIARIERARGSRVILMVHRQETMSVLGFPVFRYIDVNDSEEVIRAIQMTDPRMAVDLVLHTPGGLVLAALQIARAIHKRPGKVTVFVPHYAMSGGTLIALAADEIVMSEHAMLGPVDPQLDRYPASSILRAVARKPIAEVDDTTLILADQAEKATAQLHAAVREFLLGELPPDKSDELAALLTEGTWTHDYGITYEAAKAFGLNVSSAISGDVLRLMSLFPQPKRQGVEYLPVPYRYKEPPSRSR